MDMIERVARAIGKCQTGLDNMDDLIHHPAQNSWETPTRKRWEQWDEDARAAIEAMREPTKAMLEACDHHPGLDESGLAQWRDMIDTALGQDAPPSLHDEAREVG